MEKLKGIAVGSIGLILTLVIIELTIPTAAGLTYGILHAFFPFIKEFYLQDWILSIVLFLVFAISVFGTVHISHRAENKLWAIVSGIVSIISFISMFSAVPSR